MAFLLHQLIEEARRDHPGAEAVRFRGASLSYADLDRSSNAFASSLVDGGVRPGDRVALQLARGIEQWIALWGILKAGGVVVPVDPAAPPARAATMLRDCGVTGLVGTPGRVRAILDEPEAPQPAIAVLTDERTGVVLGCPWRSFADAVRDLDAPRPEVHVIDLDLAIIWYTSGSTGVPKGVALSHRALMAFGQDLAHVMRLGPTDVLSGFTPLHFSLAIVDLFPAPIGRAAVALIPEETGFIAKALERAIRTEHITVWCSVPSALRLMLQGGLGERPFPDLRQLWFGGEVFPVGDLAELRRRIPDVEFIHLYGGSETMGRMFHRVEEVPLDRPTVPVGQPFPNVQVIVLKDDGTPAGPGEEGQLYTRSSMVMRGYWGDPEKTAEVMIRNPLQSDPADRICATGDVVRVRLDGLYEFVSRRDDQIKSRGVRIELADIDAALNSHPGLIEGAAVAMSDAQAGTVVLAAGVPCSEGRPPTEAEVLGHLRDRLPPSMLPRRLVFLDRLPRNSSGKVDRPALRTRVAEAER